MSYAYNIADVEIGSLQRLTQHGAVVCSFKLKNEPLRGALPFNEGDFALVIDIRLNDIVRYQEIDVIVREHRINGLTADVFKDLKVRRVYLEDVQCDPLTMTSRMIKKKLQKS